MAFNIPDGWKRITGTKIQEGDRIKTESGWCDAENLAKSKNDWKSAVGHPTSLYECVIRKERKQSKLPHHSTNYPGKNSP